MSSGDPSTALFDEYDAEYCAKATEVARKLDGLAGLGSAGEKMVGCFSFFLLFRPSRTTDGRPSSHTPPPPKKKKKKKPEARRKAVRDIERDLSEAEAVLSRMELEARSAAPTSAARGRALAAKVASYRADAAALAKRAREAAKAASNSSSNTAGGGDLARAELGLGGGASSSSGGSGGFGGGGGRSNAGGGTNDRDRVLAAGERIERSGERIAQGRAQLLQTEVSVFWWCFS